MATPSVLGTLLLIIVSSTAALPQPNQTSGPQSLDSTATPGGDFSIKNRPWHAYARYENTTCSGIIIHASWVILLESCASGNGINAESQVEIYTGVDSSNDVGQVVKARVHSTSDDPLDGVTVLHLETALIFGDSVQAARLPNVYLGFNGYGGIAAGFSANGSAGVHLQAFSGKLYTLTEDERLFAIGNSDWPTEDTYTTGTDYLETIYNPEEDDDNQLYCMVGVRKSAIENSQFVEYYPTDRMMVWFAKKLGLVMEPIGDSACGHLVNKLRQ